AAMQQSISLTKGENISLTKLAPAMTKARLALRWAPRVTDGVDFDLDASVFLLSADGKIRKPKDFVFYLNHESDNGAVVHAGDNRTGGGEGECIEIDLARVPPDVTRIAAVVTIYDADTRGQTFGQVDGAGVKLIDAGTEADVLSYDLSEDYPTQTAMVMCEIYRRDGEWKFKAIGEGFRGGLAAVCSQYGLSVEKERPGT